MYYRLHNLQEHTKEWVIQKLLGTKYFATHKYSKVFIQIQIITNSLKITEVTVKYFEKKMTMQF